MRVAVVVSRFPKFTETFVVNEILELEHLGFAVEVHPLLREERGPRQPAAEPLAARAHFDRPLGPRSMANLFRMLLRRPRALAGVVSRLVRDTWRHPPFLFKDLVLVPRICTISRDVETAGVEHVHAHFATHAGFAAFAIGRLTGLPFSIVAHGSDVHRHRAMLCTKVSESAFVATVSRYNRSVILAECGDELGERVEVVRCGVDTDAVPPAGTSCGDGVRARSGMPVVLCVGSLHEVKGQRFLIEAVARLAERSRPVEARFLGDGEDRDELEALARSLGVEDRVHFDGPTPHAEVLARYGAADLLVAPSVPSSDGRREGIPTVLMEAMAAGLPVVASDLSGIPELVHDGRTGLLVPPGDADGIADAVERLVADRALARRLGDAGRTRVVEEYDIVATSARMAELIRRSATGGASSR